MNLPQRWRKGEALPEGAVLLSSKEVLEINEKRIKKWKPKHEAWPFTYGSELMAVAAGIAGIAIIGHCRNLLRLQTYGFFSSYMGGMMIPGFTSYITHRTFVSESILQSGLSCSICVETRSGIIQMAAGGIYPLLIGPLACVIQARNFHKYAIPMMNRKKDFIKMVKITAPMKIAISSMLLAQFAFGMFIAEREWNFFENKMMKETFINNDEVGNQDNGDITFK